MKVPADKNLTDSEKIQDLLFKIEADLSMMKQLNPEKRKQYILAVQNKVKCIPFALVLQEASKVLAEISLLEDVPALLLFSKCLRSFLNNVKPSRLPKDVIFTSDPDEYWVSDQKRIQKKELFQVDGVWYNFWKSDMSGLVSLLPQQFSEECNVYDEVSHTEPDRIVARWILESAFLDFLQEKIPGADQGSSLSTYMDILRKQVGMTISTSSYSENSLFSATHFFDAALSRAGRRWNEAPQTSLGERLPRDEASYNGEESLSRPDLLSLQNKYHERGAGFDVLSWLSPQLYWADEARRYYPNKPQSRSAIRYMLRKPFLDTYQGLHLRKRPHLDQQALEALTLDLFLWKPFPYQTLISESSKSPSKGYNVHIKHCLEKRDIIMMCFLLQVFIHQSENRYEFFDKLLPGVPMDHILMSKEKGGNKSIPYRLARIGRHAPSFFNHHSISDLEQQSLHLLRNFSKCIVQPVEVWDEFGVYEKLEKSVRSTSIPPVDAEYHHLFQCWVDLLNTDYRVFFETQTSEGQTAAQMLSGLWMRRVLVRRREIADVLSPDPVFQAYSHGATTKEISPNDFPRRVLEAKKKGQFFIIKEVRRNLITVYFLDYMKDHLRSR